jgi:tetratricopeptide (TPR) repeat protein
MSGTKHNRTLSLRPEKRPEDSGRSSAGYVGGLIVMTLASCLLSACVTVAPDVDPVGSNYERIEVPPVPGDPVVQARRAFAAGNYAHAARYFEQALERDPERKDALLGVAASYDQIGRFDLSDPVYEKASVVMPGDPALYNNMGYSHLLRGDLQNAQAYFAQAAKSTPGNPTIDGNRRLLVEVARNVPVQAPIAQ